jgi:hypothetical protein
MCSVVGESSGLIKNDGPWSGHSYGYDTFREIYIHSRPTRKHYHTSSLYLSCEAAESNQVQGNGSSLSGYQCHIHVIYAIF